MTDNPLNLFISSDNTKEGPLYDINNYTFGLWGNSMLQEYNNDVEDVAQTA